MKVVRWIISIPIAISVVLSIVIMLAKLDYVNNLTTKNQLVYIILHFVGGIAMSGLPLFITYLIVPNNKKTTVRLLFLAEVLCILINIVLVTNTLMRTRFWYMWKGFAYLTPLGMILGAILGLLLCTKTS